MPAGLQVWDASGNLIVDLTDRLARVLGATRINGSAGSFYDANLAAGDGFYAFQPENVFGFIDGDVSRPIFNLSAGTLSWSYSPPHGSHNSKQVGFLFYGVR